MTILGKRGLKPLGVVVVGQTPPPHGGQAIMIAKMLDEQYSGVRLHHVRMAFSREMDEVGRFRFGKLLHLPALIVRILGTRMLRRAGVLYYPPAGPDRLPMYRDFVTLLCTRWAFRRVIFHFHAGGISEVYDKLGHVERFLFRKAYFGADIGIRVSPSAPDDPKRLAVRREAVVPNGIEDLASPKGKLVPKTDPPTILYVGVVSRTKGIEVLLEACSLLSRAGHRFRVEIVGQFESAEFREQVTEIVEKGQLASLVAWRGVLTGEQKLDAFRRAAMFCFPTFFESETSGLVLLEAMQFRLPIIATEWRGIPDLVEDGENGFLVPVKDSKALAEKLSLLLNDVVLRQKLGDRGRELYEKGFTSNAFRVRMQKVFDSLVNSYADA